LHEQHRAAVLIDDPLIADSAVLGVARALQLANVTAISARSSLGEETIAAIRDLAGEGFIESPEEAAVWIEKRFC